MADSLQQPSESNIGKMPNQSGHRSRTPTGSKDSKKGVHRNAEPQFNGLNRAQILRQQIPGVGIVASVLKPRVLEASEGEQYVSLELFEKIKENSLLCQICTGIYYEPKSAGNCLHKFCKGCIDMYIKRIKKNCPICRQVITSHRNLRDDHKTKRIVEIMISNIEKYNGNLQNLRQQEIHQVHNFEQFRADMESRWQRQMEIAMEQERQSPDGRESKHARQEDAMRRAGNTNKSAVRTDPQVPLQPARRGRPPKSLSNAHALATQPSTQSSNLAAVIKDEVMEDDEQIPNARGRPRKPKIIVPYQPRNANGTFAKQPEIEENFEEEKVTNSQLSAKQGERRMSKDRQRFERDVIRISSNQSLRKPADIFKIGKQSNLTNQAPLEQQSYASQNQKNSTKLANLSSSVEDGTRSHQSAKNHVITLAAKQMGKQGIKRPELATNERIGSGKHTPSRIVMPHAVVARKSSHEQANNRVHAQSEYASNKSGYSIHKMPKAPTTQPQSLKEFQPQPDHEAQSQAQTHARFVPLSSGASIKVNQSKPSAIQQPAGPKLSASAIYRNKIERQQNAGNTQQQLNFKSIGQKEAAPIRDPLHVGKTTPSSNAIQKKKVSDVHLYNTMKSSQQQFANREQAQTAQSSQPQINSKAEISPRDSDRPSPRKQESEQQLASIKQVFNQANSVQQATKTSQLPSDAPKSTNAEQDKASLTPGKLQNVTDQVKQASAAYGSKQTLTDEAQANSEDHEMGDENPEERSVDEEHEEENDQNATQAQDQEMRDSEPQPNVTASDVEPQKIIRQSQNQQLASNFKVNAPNKPIDLNNGIAIASKQNFAHEEKKISRENIIPSDQRKVIDLDQLNKSHQSNGKEENQAKRHNISNNNENNNHGLPMAELAPKFKFTQNNNFKNQRVAAGASPDLHPRFDDKSDITSNSVVPPQQQQQQPPLQGTAQSYNQLQTSQDQLFQTQVASQHNQISGTASMPQGMQARSYIEDLQSKQIQFQQQIIFQLYQAYIQQRFYNEQIHQQLQFQSMQQSMKNQGSQQAGMSLGGFGPSMPIMQLGQFPGLLPQAVFSVSPNVYQQGLPIIQPHMTSMPPSQLPSPLDLQNQMGGQSNAAQLPLPPSNTAAEYNMMQQTAVASQQAQALQALSQQNQLATMMRHENMEPNPAVPTHLSNAQDAGQSPLNGQQSASKPNQLSRIALNEQADKLQDPMKANELNKQQTMEMDHLASLKRANTSQQEQNLDQAEPQAHGKEHERPILPLPEQSLPRASAAQPVMPSLEQEMARQAFVQPWGSDGRKLSQPNQARNMTPQKLPHPSLLPSYQQQQHLAQQSKPEDIGQTGSTLHTAAQPQLRNDNPAIVNGMNPAQALIQPQMQHKAQGQPATSQLQDPVSQAQAEQIQAPKMPHQFISEQNNRAQANEVEFAAAQQFNAEQQLQDSVQLLNGKGSVKLNEVLNAVVQTSQQQPVIPNQPLSSVLVGKEVFFDMQVDNQFPNIFKEKNIKQPFTMFRIKTNIEAKASQLINTLLDRLRKVGKREPEIAELDITEANISLYFLCDNGDRWWFENTQRVADIIDSGYWKPEALLRNERGGRSIKCIYFVIYKRC